MRSLWNSAAVLGALCATIMLTGCGGGVSRTSVSGKVTIDGKAPGTTGVMIAFIGPDNQTASGEVGADGSFTVSGVYVGENKISLNMNQPVDTSQVNFEGLDAEKAGDRKKKLEEEKAKAGPPKVNPVPTRYNDPTGSGLKFIAEKGGSNTYNVDLKK